ncbi:unnamed protein product [Nippostrongylus brasiliensis]|uniref:ANF_receptor domain-containing protein n=1 Tax=Nippostrongylus brasiliensis TaxID=27835 RepID=A0A158R022_NIPBR|nr:unnamed protein product [Nippostrongylus brasiliensis]
MGFVICVSLIVVAICLNALREQDLGVQSLVARRVPGNEKFVALLPCKEKLANQIDVVHTKVPLAMPEEAALAPWKYEDPIKRMMDAMCVHTRVNDFEAFGWLTSIESVFTASHLLAKKHNLSRYLIFGDSEHFMQRLAGMLNDHHAGEDRAMVSRNGVFEDMYLASRLCKAFLISSSLSTFGWFLAFFTQDQEAVYYMNDGRNSSVDIPYLRDFFLSRSSAREHSGSIYQKYSTLPPVPHLTV